METEIARLRRRQNLTVSAAARAGNSYSSDWHKAERGEKVHPKLRRIIAVVLAVSEGDLFDAQGWPREAVSQVASA